MEAFRSRGLTKIPTGPGDQAHLSFTVPGIVDGYVKLLETYGTKTLGEVLAPAIDHAQHGFPMYEYMHRLLRISQTWSSFNAIPREAEVFYPAGQVPAVGSLFVQPQLGQTLRLLVEAERAAPGSRRPALQAARRMFYEGEIAHRIATFSERVGGLLRLEDLQRYQAGFKRPSAPRLLAMRSVPSPPGRRQRCCSSPSMRWSISTCAPWDTILQPISTP